MVSKAAKIAASIIFVTVVIIIIVVVSTHIDNNNHVDIDHLSRLMASKYRRYQSNVANIKEKNEKNETVVSGGAGTYLIFIIKSYSQYSSAFICCSREYFFDQKC